MNIGIPDKIYKLLVSLGIILIGYSEIKYTDSINDWKKEYQMNISLRDSFDLQKISMDFELEKMENSYDLLNKISNESNNKISEVYVDSLSRVKGKLFSLKKKNTINTKILESFLEKSKTLQENLSFINSNYKYLQHIGFLLFSFGILMWMIDDNKESQSLTKQNEKLYSWCQSCGKSFSPIIKYGTNEDSSDNYSFCDTCYTDGKFNNPNLTKDEFMELVKNEISHKSWWSKNILISRFHHLARWNENKY